MQELKPNYRTVYVNGLSVQMAEPVKYKSGAPKRTTVAYMQSDKTRTVHGLDYSEAFSEVVLNLVMNTDNVNLVKDISRKDALSSKITLLDNDLKSFINFKNMVLTEPPEIDTNEGSFEITFQGDSL